MTNPLCRARRLAPAILLAPIFLLTLAACGAPAAQSRLTANQAAQDPPQLWRVESLDNAGRVTGATLVCTDQSMRDGFGRADAEVWGRPCLPHRDAVDRPDLYAVTCAPTSRPLSPSPPWTAAGRRRGRCGASGARAPAPPAGSSETRPDRTGAAG